MPLFHHMTKGPIKGFWGSVSSICRVPDCLFESVWISFCRFKNQTCLIFFTTVTNPLLPLPTNFPVSDFMKPQTEIYTILCYLRLPKSVNARSALVLFPGGLDLVPDSSTTPMRKKKMKIGHCCLKKSVISLRKSHTSLKGTNRELSEEV